MKLREAPPSIYGRLDLALGPDGVPKFTGKFLPLGSPAVMVFVK